LTNNDILRRIRYTFNFNDKQMVAIFALADQQVTREQVCNWLKKEEDSDYVNCTDVQLATFLNGFINEKRGKRDGEQPAAEKKLTNNIILTKLKIAFSLKAEEIIELLNAADLRISKPELSAFFRKPDHKHYRQCKDQILRNFLQGMQEKYYVERSRKIDFNVEKATDSTAENASDTPYGSRIQGWRADKDDEVKVGQSVRNSAHDSTKNKDNKSATRSNKAKSPKTIYVNPKATITEKAAPKRKVLKLKPEDIWKNS